MPYPTLTELPPPPPGRTGWPWTVASPHLPETMPDGAPWPRVSIVTPSYDRPLSCLRIGLVTKAGQLWYDSQGAAKPTLRGLRWGLP